jgi:hypothetical protein
VSYVSVVGWAMKGGGSKRCQHSEREYCVGLLWHRNSVLYTEIAATELHPPSAGGHIHHCAARGVTESLGRDGIDTIINSDREGPSPFGLHSRTGRGQWSNSGRE